MTKRNKSQNFVLLLFGVLAGEEELPGGHGGRRDWPQQVAAWRGGATREATP